jgi:hypothetical protein
VACENSSPLDHGGPRSNNEVLSFIDATADIVALQVGDSRASSSHQTSYGTLQLCPAA